MATECGQNVGRGVVNFPCTLDKDHEGPCFAIENDQSRRERDRWQRGQTSSALSKAIDIIDPDFEEQQIAAEQVEPTKQREGDQPLPIVNDRPFIQDLVIADIEARKQVGIQRYGTPLQPFNGRDVLQDLYEELIDAACYIKQAIVERDSGG